jgi:hypothetical protein
MTTTDPQLIDLTQPNIISIKKKKKRKYSRGLKGFQTAGRRSSKITARVMRSVSKGFDEFRKASDKSSRKHRDGALLDMNRNVAKGLSVSLKSANRIPLDLVDIWDTKRSRRNARRQTRRAARLVRVFRLR